MVQIHLKSISSIHINGRKRIQHFPWPGSRSSPTWIPWRTSNLLCPTCSIPVSAPIHPSIPLHALQPTSLQPILSWTSRHRWGISWTEYQECRRGCRCASWLQLSVPARTLSHTCFQGPNCPLATAIILKSDQPCQICGSRNRQYLCCHLPLIRSLLEPTC